MGVEAQEVRRRKAAAARAIRVTGGSAGQDS
jgi:hypothetical protein